MPKGQPLPPLQAGQVFGRLTVIREGAPRYFAANKINRVMLCQCECGTETEVHVSALRRGATTSCGCLWRERITKHGKSHSRAYGAWQHMHARCSPSFPEARNYHQRGICVCQEWTGAGGFNRFYAEMGDPPPRTSLDRIDNNRGYEPGNCRWATQAQQMHNVRINVWIELPGGTPAVLEEACRLTGVSRRSITNKVWRDHVTHQQAFDHYLTKLPRVVTRRKKRGSVISS